MDIITYGYIFSSSLKLLQNAFKDQISVFLAKSHSNEVLSGALICKSERVVHTQYLASNSSGRELGALDLLIKSQIDYFLSSDVSIDYISLGTSLSHLSGCINDGLLFQKEGFGARAQILDEYVVEFNS